MKIRPAAVIILHKNKKILLQHRAEDAVRNPGLWGCFGGGIEEGETPLEAVKREAFEELEYTLKNPRHIDTETRDQDDLRATTHTFTEEYDGTPVVLHEGQGYGWFTIEEALELKISAGRRDALLRLRDTIFS